MNDPSVNKCQDVVDGLDAYLDHVLPPDSTSRVLAHAQGCASCARELAMRRTLRARLKMAVQSVETPAFLETRVRAHLRQTRGAFVWKLSLAAVAVAAVVCMSGSVAYQYGYFRSTRPSQESYIASVSNQVAGLMRVGLGDHIHCAVFRKYPKNPPPMTQFLQDMGPKYSGLIRIVRERVPDAFRLEQAHQCHYHKRGFVHMILKSDSRLLSLVIANKGEGPPVSGAELIPAFTESGIGIFGASVQRFQIAAFETRDHIVYVISDMPRQQNMDMMRAMAPSVKTYLTKLES